MIMKIWILKHKGKSWVGNLIGIGGGEMKFQDGHECYFGEYFFFKRDAVKRMNAYEHKEFLEVVSATVQYCDRDNRKNIL